MQSSLSTTVCRTLDIAGIGGLIASGVLLFIAIQSPNIVHQGQAFSVYFSAFSGAVVCLLVARVWELLAVKLDEPPFTPIQPPSAPLNSRTV